MDLRLTAEGSLSYSLASYVPVRPQLLRLVNIIFPLMTKSEVMFSLTVAPSNQNSSGPRTHHSRAWGISLATPKLRQRKASIQTWTIITILDISVSANPKAFVLSYIVGSKPISRTMVFT